MLLDARLQHGTPHRNRAGRPAAPAPRPAAGDDLPPELAFLLAQGVAPALLRRAALIAAEVDVPGEDALFGLGFPDERFARLLARHLGAPYL